MMSYYMSHTSDLELGSSSVNLQHLSNDELKQLLNDDNEMRFDDMIKEAPQVKALESERDMLIASNKSLAEFNLSREPSYRNMRQTLIDAHTEAKSLKDDIDKKKGRLSELSRQTSLDTTLALLQTAAAQAEEESDNMSAAFLAREVNLDTFIKEFIERRKLAHLRRIKTEKLMEEMRQNMNANQSGVNPMYQPIRAAPAPPLPFASQQYPPPYPQTWPMQMPPNQSYPYSRPAYR